MRLTDAKGRLRQPRPTDKGRGNTFSNTRKKGGSWIVPPPCIQRFLKILTVEHVVEYSVFLEHLAVH